MFYSDNKSYFDTKILSHLRLIGTKAQCSSHKGVISNYFVAGQHLYAIIDLDCSYWTENQETNIKSLVVHASNLEDYEEENINESN